jgi:transcriptional regulator with XRE-family HTH domain
MIDAKQIRAARALLNWSREELAEQTGISVPALARAETGESQLRASSKEKIKYALEQAGIIFTDGSGVKMRNEIVRIFEGLEGIDRFYNEIYAAAQTMTREFLQFGLRYKDIKLFHKDEAMKRYRQNMMGLKKNIFRCIISEEERHLEKTNYALYRYWPIEKFIGTPFYVFEDNFSILSTRNDNIQAIVISDSKVAEEYRRQFDIMWGLAHD